MSDSPGLFQEHTLLTRLHAETRALLAVTSDEYRDYKARGDARSRKGPTDASAHATMRDKP
jgi:hypothetical protein